MLTGMRRASSWRSTCPLALSRWRRSALLELSFRWLISEFQGRLTGSTESRENKFAVAGQSNLNWTQPECRRDFGIAAAGRSSEFSEFRTGHGFAPVGSQGLQQPVQRVAQVVGRGFAVLNVPAPSLNDGLDVNLGALLKVEASHFSEHAQIKQAVF